MKIRYQNLTITLLLKILLNYGLIYEGFIKIKFTKILFASTVSFRIYSNNGSGAGKYMVLLRPPFFLKFYFVSNYAISSPLLCHCFENCFFFIIIQQVQAVVNPKLSNNINFLKMETGS
jgi:hypothetical protein